MKLSNSKSYLIRFFLIQDSQADDGLPRLKIRLEDPHNYQTILFESTDALKDFLDEQLKKTFPNHENK